MSFFLRCGLLAAALYAAPALAAPRPDPADPRASVQPLQHHSALHTYRRLGDNPPRDWREANDTVTRIGGWRTYLREAQQPAPTPGAVPPKPGEARP